MSTPDLMEYDPDENEQRVLDVIRREGRVNPLRVREETDLRKQYVNDALRQLQKANVVRKVNRGLYEHVPENDDVSPAADIDVEALREAITDAKAAYEDVDGDGVREALAWMGAILEDGEVADGDV